MIVTLMSLLGALVLVGGGLWRRRLGSRRLLWLSLTWLGIIAAVWAVASLGLHLRPDRDFT